MDVLQRLRRTPATKDLKADAIFILLAATGLTLLREATMRLVLRPIAAKCVVSVSPDESTSSSSKAADAKTQNGTNGNGAVSRAKQSAPPKVLSKRQRRRLEHLQRRNEIRFAEQGWSVLYFSCASLVGLYIAIHQPWWPMNVKEFWTDWPELKINALLKYYYLTQSGFYVHQMVVLFSEARRKDHWQMFSHHVITVGLQWTSYVVCYHRVGVAVMLLLDPCDILLSAAKMLRYAGVQTVCDIVFGLFLLAWLVLRHILYLRVLYSVIYDVDLTSDVGSPKASIHRGLIAGLVALQVLLLMWFVMIVKVAYRVVTGSGAADTRSDDEDEDDVVEGSDDEVVTNGANSGRATASTALNGTNQARQRTSKA
ncbi:unnamed protein product [Tilletia laevis]|uniref:TLC domain-containing protein n=3 Tax=Tilletia TaxID=13289 RepID=A0A8X7T009_9BASI|nr:hypothetical protein CF335_g4126 [Tilletia laevis]KAE8204768.1 hypothetical protein CF328_g895 [Tilletia controversa]KAE8257414.1 hypothetical protein A4X03_0g4677 [Tilletia caries]KAE8254241.1 hypothetical protein A4X06_0g997 [Tilletia controversa]CAD6893233.1 unnamed protein product [Tilletia caries]